MKKHRIQAMACLLGSFFLYGILTLTAEPERVVSAEGGVVRNSYGGEAQQVQLYVEGLGEEELALAIEIGAREYTREEAEQVFSLLMEAMEERIKGDNSSLMAVQSDLKLPSWIDEYGIRLRWYSSNPEWMDSGGKIKTLLAADDSEGKMLYLGVQLSDGTYKQEYEIPVRLIPPKRSEWQRLSDGLKQEIQKREEGQRTKEELSLPMEYEGKQLYYRTKEESPYTILLVLGIILAVLCYAKVHADLQTQEKQREKELLLDYAEIVSKLMVFIGAGMTVRLVWERIVKDYEVALTQGRQKKRAAYEEMSQTYYQMQSGVSEGEAFREFGRRCRLQPYLKLSSLLEQNRKAGNKNLRAMLQTEMADAWEQRKNLARKLGEEAGTKLLMPLFLMLGIVMVMIMVPAMLTMG